MPSLGKLRVTSALIGSMALKGCSKLSIGFGEHDGLQSAGDQTKPRTLHVLTCTTAELHLYSNNLSKFGTQSLMTFNCPFKNLCKSQ